MRKYILLLTLVFVVTSCKDDETQEGFKNSNKTHFNPPNWIQGNWGYFNNNSYSFRFTKNNFYVNSGSEIDYNNMINSTNQGVSELSVEEFNTDNSYRFSLKGGSVSANFEFKKVNDKTILHITSGTELEMYKK